ncbi:V-type ATP synthase subunit D [Motiliproteus sediminis]|uniref:V-type ATP synthase subunit D n=1 Tax=Motiliproteus sediminis TaxID=1468178 RepID=UPI001AEFE7EE|nr:V-type ATP synthase subunit D [Motiliproteus sediminis]
MGKLALNKSSMHRESKRLKSFEQYLPALDLKRKQIIGERFKARRRMAEIEQEIAEQRQRVGEQLPMLAEMNLELEGLVQLEQVTLGDENLVGIHLPVLADLRVARAPYSLFSRPHWIDALANQLEQMLRLKLEKRIQHRRIELLEQALQKTTQRINLFEKVLIPQARENIRRIQIFLSDGERAGVVRAKISKDKKRRAG